MDSYPIRERSVNVRGSFRDRLKTNSWRNRSTLNVVTIKRHAATLIGFQECRRDNRRAYGKNLPRYADLLGPKYGNAVRPDSNALLFDPKGPGLLDSGGLRPGEASEKYSSSWEAGVVRSANWALWRIVDTGLSLLHLITHFDHKSGLVRRAVAGSSSIAEELSKRFGGAPTIVVTGNFRCYSGNPTYQNFAEDGFVDNHLAAGN